MAQKSKYRDLYKVLAALGPETQGVGANIIAQRKRKREDYNHEIDVQKDNEWLRKRDSDIEAERTLQALEGQVGFKGDSTLGAGTQAGINQGMSLPRQQGEDVGRAIENPILAYQNAYRQKFGANLPEQFMPQEAPTAVELYKEHTAKEALKNWDKLSSKQRNEVLFGLEEEPIETAATLTERGFAKLLNPNTPESERILWEKKLFPSKNGKPTVKGVDILEIGRVINLLYPLNRFGKRQGLPEGLDPNSLVFLEHGADLILSATGNNIPQGADEFDEDVIWNDKYSRKK